MRLKNFLCWLVLGLLPFSASVAHAEGGCPAGLIPYRGNDVSSCGPIPAGYYNNQRQQEPIQPLPSIWLSRWGAIATDAQKGILGTSTDMPSKQEAEAFALSQCGSKGGLQCKVNLAYDNGCAVMVAGDTAYNANADATLEKATREGLQTCNGATTNCHVYYSDCSLPTRIQ